MLEKVNIQSNGRVQLLDITAEVKKVVNHSGIADGIVTVYTPHTTAGITINENADPDVVKDIIMEINKLISFDDNYAHFEGNSAAHLKSSLFAASETIILEKGNLLLGTWQGIYFCEFDGPRTRQLYIKIIEG